MQLVLIVSSFVAGVFTILAPCVLPLLPVIIGTTAGSKDPRKPFVVTASLGISIVIFTLLLKSSTLLIDIPENFWNGLSGGIVLVFGLLMVFPDFWNMISLKLGFDSSSQSWLQKVSNNDSLVGSILVGAALGPVFSSCSPTYFVILATVLPANFLTGVIYLGVYVLGLTMTLAIIGYWGQRVVVKLKWASNPNGTCKRSMGLLLIVVGLLVITGYSKRLEAGIIKSGYDGTDLENKILGAAQMFEGDHMEPVSKQEKYQDYSLSNVQQAQEKGYNYAFFFHADWCSSCHAIEKTITNNLDKLPEQSIIFKVDFDKSKDLKKELNVLTQSMLVFFDDKGNVVDRKINPDLDRIIKGLSRDTNNMLKAKKNTSLESAVNEIKNKKSTFASSKDFYSFLQKEESLEQATFAGGCFWCLEGPLEAESGVIEAFSGYAGGDVVDPSYQEVSSGSTGAREAVTVFYDPKTVSYEKLLEVFWRQIDPTDAGGQFADRGSHYTTAIFYRDSDQQVKANASKKELEDSGKFSQIATQILEFESFYLAEEYHQDYYIKSSDHYNRYKVGSGRAGNIKKNADTFDEIFTNSTYDMTAKSYTKPSDSEIRSMLGDQAYAVTQKGATERPFNNAYWDNHQDGIYVDVVTGEPLFSSTDKFDSGTGWPSFTKPIDENFITENEDNKLLVSRTEVKSKTGKSHLGHVFNDGPKDKGGMRYCINSAALRFIPKEDLKKEGYAEYERLFDEAL